MKKLSRLTVQTFFFFLLFLAGENASAQLTIESGTTRVSDSVTQVVLDSTGIRYNANLIVLGNTFHFSGARNTFIEGSTVPKFSSLVLNTGVPAMLNKGTINLNFTRRDILSLMDSLRISKAILLGHSWGALLATMFATEYPEKVQSMVLMGPGPVSYENKYWDQLVENKRSKITAAQWNRYSKLYWKVNAKTIDSTELKEYKWLNSAMTIYDTSNAEKVFNNINKGERNQQTFLLLAIPLQQKGYDLTKNISGLTMPIDIITGKEDPAAFLTTAFQQFAPAAKIHWIEKSGHFPMYEQPEKFYAVLMEVLSKQAVSR